MRACELINSPLESETSIDAIAPDGRVQISFCFLSRLYGGDGDLTGQTIGKA